MNVHPVFVHFPLGVWPVAFGFLLFGAARQSERAFEVGRWLLHLATLAAAVTATTGWLAANGLNHDSIGHELVHTHRNWMLVSTGMSFATSLLALATRRSGRLRARWVLAGALALTLAVATLGADRGAYLVYGKGVGTALSTNQTPLNIGPDDGPEADEAEHEH